MVLVLVVNGLSIRHFSHGDKLVVVVAVVVVVVVETLLPVVAVVFEFLVVVVVTLPCLFYNVKVFIFVKAPISALTGGHVGSGLCYIRAYTPLSALPGSGRHETDRQ